MVIQRFKTLLTLLVLLLLVSPALALESGKQSELDRVMKLSMKQLTAESAALLDKKYPDEDWDAFNFPKYVFTNESVEVGYKIAVKEPEILTINTCYCFCDTMGHKSLLNCFLKDGQPGAAFDDHAADCNICYGQAMLAFLWHQAGIPEADIQKGMAKKFERLVEQQKKK